jgi:hypothetical protein
MIIKTRIFDLFDNDYDSLPELAQVMGISVSQIYRVRAGKRGINQKFITGAIKAFPESKLDDLFYLALESPPDNTDGTIVTARHHYMVQQYNNSG